MSIIAVRPPFNPSARLIARKTGTIGGVDVSQNALIAAGALDHVGPHKLLSIWKARWFDTALPEEIEAEEPSALSTPPAAPIAPAPEQVEQPQGGEGNETPPQGAQEAQGEPQGDQGSNGTAPPAPAPPAPAEPVAVYHEGFGRWFKADAAGRKVGEKMTKAQAEATKLPAIDKPEAQG